jgi:hypothetical protein
MKKIMCDNEYLNEGSRSEIDDCLKPLEKLVSLSLYPYVFKYVLINIRYKIGLNRD